MKVIKLGGSLLASHTLSACLSAIANHPQTVVVVPGGGLFAEQVRIAQQQHGFDDLAAHRMAILAMQQMALLCHSLNPAFEIVNTARNPTSRLAIWSPDIAELDAAGIAASWSVTSDSLAAWLARQIKASELIMVKAAPIAQPTTLSDLQQHGLVDEAFLAYANGLNVRVVDQAGFLAEFS